MEKSAGIQLELKDLDTSKRTAVIKHAVYGSIDRTGDISHKGMFTKSWNEGLPDFLFNHVAGSTVGSTKRAFEDTEGGYTEVKFGNWTLGNDVLEMADEGILKGASFGYVTEKKDFSTIKGKKVRNLREVKHNETSLLTVIPAHPGAGIMTLNKAFEALEIKQLSDAEQTFLKNLLTNDMDSLQKLIVLAGSLDISSDLYRWIMYQVSRRADFADGLMSQLYWNQQQMNSIKSHVETVENYCRKAHASDESIITLQNSLQEYKQIISDYDTVITDLANQPVTSDDEMKAQLSNFVTSLNLKQWQKNQYQSN